MRLSFSGPHPGRTLEGNEVNYHRKLVQGLYITAECFVHRCSTYTDVLQDGDWYNVEELLH